MKWIYLSLGSNLGDRSYNLSLACSYLKRYLSDLEMSTVIETKPLYNSQQPSFLNQVIRGKTHLSAYSFWRITWQIQKILGRVVTTDLNQPRIIDIDIVDFEGILLQTSELILPHARLHERLYVLSLLRELDPLWVCPRSKKGVKELIQEL